MPSEFALPRFLPTDPPSGFCSKVMIGDFCAVQEWEVALQARDQLAADILQRKLDVLEKPALLAPPGDHVPIGACVQLLAADTPGWMGQDTLALGVRVDMEVRAQPFNAGCLLKCTPHVQPCQRSVFHVVAQDAAQGSSLKFGQRFVLRPAHAQHLVVRCELPTINSNVGASGLPLLSLVSGQDRYCCWTVWPKHPRGRNATQGFPVPAHARVVLRHEATGQCLAAETDHWIKAAHGFECEATAHSMLDPYGKETGCNFWMFSIQKPVDIRTPSAGCP